MQTISIAAGLLLFAAGAWVPPIDGIDTDGDGLVSLKEFRSHEPRRFPGWRHAGGDGAVSIADLKARQEERAARHAERRARALEFFEQADADGDGTVTREEMQAAAFARMDENDDGYLSEEEIAEARSDRGYGRRFRPGGRI